MLLPMSKNSGGIVDWKKTSHRSQGKILKPTAITTYPVNLTVVHNIQPKSQKLVSSMFHFGILLYLYLSGEMVLKDRLFSLLVLNKDNTQKYNFLICLI
jgi:hypothetical protein